MQSKSTAEERLNSMGERWKQLELQIREIQCIFVFKFLGKLDLSESKKFEVDSNANQLQNDVNDFKREIKLLKSELEELRNYKRKINSENYESRIDQLTQENIKLKELSNKLTEDGIKSYSQMQTLKDENFESKSLVSELKQTNLQLNSFLNQTKDELDEKSLQFFQLENEITSLKYELKKLKEIKRSKFCYIHYVIKII